MATAASKKVHLWAELDSHSRPKRVNINDQVLSATLAPVDFFLRADMPHSPHRFVADDALEGDLTLGVAGAAVKGGAPAGIVTLKLNAVKQRHRGRFRTH